MAFSQLVSKIGLVSSFTMLSRVAGLVRDMMTSAMLGTSVWNSAFIIAFTLPNLFRRLLGEGALTAALMPNLSDELETNGRDAVHRLVNKTLSWLILICATLIVLAWLGFAMLSHSSVSEKWVIAANLGKVVFPYILLICVAAVFAAVLNLFARFGIPALTAVWLNVSMVVALGIGGWWLAGDIESRTYWLCGGAMVGGALQMVVPAVALLKEGWRPEFDLGVSPKLREVALLTVPGIFGAAVFQINIIVSRGLAFYVSDAAASLLYYANRLVELPVGVFAIAISTVIFPALSQAIAANRMSAFAETYKRGILLCLLFALPSAVGLAVLAPEIIDLLFQRGLFSEEDTASTIPLVVVFAIGMPFYSFVSVETRAFFSLKDTQTPVRVAALAFVVNIALSLALMKRFGAVGLAIASNFAAIAQAVLLHLALRRKNLDTRLRELLADSARIAIAAALMGVGVWFGRSLFVVWFGDGLGALLATVGGLILVGSGLYFAVIHFSGLKWRALLR
ncbi:murein biosynthesis integral membrane protein MurJ [Pelagicoccus sp. SDUM812003]|uniref:murein biosynthesis integral membrane protein MurJ n=1 Tax=Pelagicoccus sp. SDUM812003 TaxID=3041267 RepID=UPI00280CD9EB|nr:murein biosynthesis integral membrane protein MurJ [Pelagicoccus sp. SDUM812003]MDQ8202138.1 murein biosynthesis integral membrane protein MurJ [Pelagicoccus sp. SDUM812003]